MRRCGLTADGHSTDVLGRVVEVVSGISLPEFFQREMFTPLGMNDTGFGLPRGGEAKLADLWYRCGNPVAEVRTTDVSAATQATGEHVLGEVTVPSGGGGLLSTTTDYFRFCQMVLDGGLGLSPDGTAPRPRLLSRKGVEWMAMNHLMDGLDMAALALPGYTEVSGPGQGFGLGLSVSLDPVASRENVSPGTVGWGGLASTLFYIDPLEQLVVIFMTQIIGKVLVLGRSPKRAPRNIMQGNDGHRRGGGGGGGGCVCVCEGGREGEGRVR